MRQNILVVFLILLLLTGGFIWLRYMRGTAPAVPTVGEGASGRLSQYKQLQNLKPDLSIFADPLFRSLERTLPSPTGGPPPVGSGDIRAGRTNPFNPL